MSDALVGDLLRQLGVASIAVLLALLGGKSFLQSWISARVTAGVAEGVDKRMAAFRLELDKDLERYRTRLATEFEHLRSRLERDATDYSIWAQQRHERTATLFAEYLKAEICVTSMPDLMYTDYASFSRVQLAELLERAKADSTSCERILELHDTGDRSEAERQLDVALLSARRGRVIQARNAASEAYYASALYLSHAVDGAAIEVRDQFHAFVVAYMAPKDTGRELFELKTKLRFFMLELQNKARADLSKSTAIFASPPGAA